MLKFKCEVSLMDSILEKMLQVDEQMFPKECGFISSNGEKIIVDHEDYAVKYLRKHNLSVPRSHEGKMVKFLNVSGYIRYYITDEEVGLTINAPVNSDQVYTIKKMSGRDKDIVFDIIDEDGSTIEYGNGFSNLISSLRNTDLSKE